MTWDCLWVNAHLATLDTDNDYGIIKNAAIASQAGKIVWLGPQSELNLPLESLASKVIDCDGAFITPGLIDSHTHIVYAGQRAQEFEQRLAGKSYQEIAQAGGGIRSTVAATRAASPEELFQQSAKRLEAMLAQGVTTLEIKSGYGLTLEDELKMLKVAKQLADAYPVTVKTTCLAAHTVPVEYQDQPDDYIKYVCEQILPAVKEQNLADFVDVFAESIAFNLSQTQRVFERAQQLSLGIKCHADQLSDLGASQLAAEYGAVSVDHCEFTSAKSIAALAKHKTCVVLLPGAFYFLQETQKPPLAEFIKHNIPLAIATDCNPGSSPSTSLPLMMNLSAVLWGMTPLAALAGVTRHAASALGLGNSHGQLALGFAADFALWDISHPVDLIYHIGGNYCKGRVVAGQPV